MGEYMKNITFEEMLNMEVQDLLHGYPSGGIHIIIKMVMADIMKLLNWICCVVDL